MMLKFFDLQRIIDKLIFDGWVALWPLDEI